MPTQRQQQKLAEALQRIQPEQRTALHSYIRHVVLDGMVERTWHRTDGIGSPPYTTWIDWRVQPVFAEVKALYERIVEKQRLAREMHYVNEITKHEAKTRLTMARAKPQVASRMEEIALDGPTRDAVAAGKIILDYNTTPPMASTETADAFLRASVPLEAAGDEIPNPE